MAAGDLVRRHGKWITEPPTHCPNGHQLGPHRVLVGHTACSGHAGGGHTIWHCVECDAITYGPPIAAHCSVTVGPAYLRRFRRRGHDDRDPVADTLIVANHLHPR